MAPPKIPTVRLASGSNLPVIGLGTWQANPGQVKEAVREAIELGYRHFDCAHIYGNEEEIGEAFAEKIKDGVVKREELFVTSKVWNNSHSTAAVHAALDKTLKALRLDYLDLYIIHWPFGYQEGGPDPSPKDPTGKVIPSDIDYLETYRALEELQKAGKLKNIGLSNFNIEQTRRVVENCSIAPSSNQFEVHVYLQNRELVDYCKSQNIVVVAYSPLGSNERTKSADFIAFPPPLEDAVVKKIADKHKKLPGHVLLKFLLQQDLVVIPKSSNKERLKSNLELFDFTLDKDDLTQLASLDKKGDYRCWTMGRDADHKYYPFDRKYASNPSN
ncbi:1,5-anhydro-D-fructose reductase [Hypsibius exemplaris]|uniref:1,5-anhydro-D-fructose reductase n=1 Tax=Hypsibius exemplaris TaxID=2072580 RepID=A0A1W0XC84_HYPEX|nr:1,5-anhydro-D-fructose reductase [Hypsibius exemplaris]